VFTIEHAEIKPLRADHDYYPALPAGESTCMTARGVVLHPALTSMIPPATTLEPLTSTEDVHTYKLEVRGYTVEQFIAIATAYANADFAEADRLIAELH
jgi:hypothetical protein